MGGGRGGSLCRRRWVSQVLADCIQLHIIFCPSVFTTLSVPQRAAVLAGGRLRGGCGFFLNCNTPTSNIRPAFLTYCLILSSFPGHTGVYIPVTDANVQEYHTL